MCQSQTWLCSRSMRLQWSPKNWPGLAHHRVSLGQWSVEHPISRALAQWSVEHPTRSRRVVGSIPMWDSEFSEFVFLNAFTYEIKIIQREIKKKKNRFNGSRCGCSWEKTGRWFVIITVAFQATFEGWMEVMEDAIDATKVGNIYPYFTTPVYIRPTRLNSQKSHYIAKDFCVIT